MRSTKSLPFVPTSTTTSTTTTSSKLSTALHSFFGSSSSSSSSSQSSITPPPAYHALYPPSPPASPPTLASSAASIRSTTSSTKSSYINPLQQALASPCTPIKPLLTPRSSHDGPSSSSSDAEVERKGNILSTIFPSSSPLHQLPATKVELSEIVPSWKGAVLENPAMGTRTLYVEGGSYEEVNMRESVCGVLELAEEQLGCTGVVMVLEKNSAEISEYFAWERERRTRKELIS